MNATEERRRSARYPVAGRELAILPVSLSVQLLDISASGVLVLSSHPAKEGSRAQLRLNLGGKPISADVEIRRVAPGIEGHGYRIGVSFVDLKKEQRQLIEEFTQ